MIEQLSRPTPFPAELLLPVAWHEVGHALMAIYHGHTIGYVWIGDGAEKAPPHATPGIDDPHVVGECHSQLKIDETDVEGMATDLFYRILTLCAPIAAEHLNPRRHDYITWGQKYPDFFFEDSGYTQGSWMEAQDAWTKMRPIYHLLGVETPLRAIVAFQRFWLMRAHDIIEKMRPQAEALVSALVEKRYMTGKEVHEIVCATGHGKAECHDGIHMPGCDCIRGALSADLLKRLEETYKDIEVTSAVNTMAMLLEKHI